MPIGASGDERGLKMLDVLVVAITVGFFAGCVSYVFGCERL